MKDLTLSVMQNGEKTSLLIEAPDDVFDRITVSQLRNAVQKFSPMKTESLIQGLPVFKFEFSQLTLWGILYEEFGPRGEDMLSLIYPPV